MSQPPISEDDATRGFVLIARQVDLWWQLFERGIGSPPDGSPLAGDDRWTDGYPLSHAVWHLISAGIDNMHAFRTMTVSGGPTEYNVSTRPYGGFPNLRAAMENAAAAIWMLAPDGRAERVARYLRWLRQEAWYRDKVRELQGLPEDPTDEMRDWIAQVVTDQDIDPTLVKGRPKFENLVFEAAENIGMTGAVGQLVWATMSGMAHGERWASLTLNEMEETGKLPNPEHLSVRLTTPVGRLLLLATVATKYLRGALDLQDQRRMSPY